MSAQIIQQLVGKDTQASFARKVGASPAMVWQWANGLRPVSPKFAIRIEAEYGTSRHDLRPDVFGPAPKRQKSRAA